MSDTHESSLDALEAEVGAFREVAALAAHISTITDRLPVNQRRIALSAAITLILRPGDLDEDERRRQYRDGIGGISDAITRLLAAQRHAGQEVNAADLSFRRTLLRALANLEQS